MFDLNEPADDAAAGAAAPAAQEQEVLGDEEEPKMIKPPPSTSEVAVAEAVLSLMAPLPPASQQEILHQLDSKPSDECRGLSPVSEEDKDDDNVSSAAKQWSLRTLPEEDACINITSSSSNSSKQERSSSWPRSERPATVMRSGSFHMLFDDRPNSADPPPPPPANNVDCSPENGRLEEAEELVEDHEQQYPTRTSPENNLCEFLPLITPTTAKNGNSEVVTDHEAIDLIDVFGVREDEAAAKADDPKTLIKLGSPPEAQDEQQQQGGLEQASRDGDEAGEEEGLSGELAVDEARFGRLIWQGRVNFRDVTVNNMVAACAKRWEYVFGKRKLPDLLKVQRFLASTDKFVCAVKDYMAEPAIKMIQKSGSSSQNLNKLVQVLVGGGTGIDSDLSLHAVAAAAEAAASFKGPLVAVIPLQDEGNVWLADLYLLAASVLSDVEPGELSLTDEGVLYGFLAASPTNANSSDESFAWLKDGNRPDVETTLKSSPSESKNSKKPRASSNGEAPVEKRGVRSSSEMSGDYKQQQQPQPQPQQQQELEEGQLVSEDLGVKETTFLTYERRKRYTEDEKKAKVNGGETEAKTRDRSHRTHRDHERDRDQERERGAGVRRDRDGDAGNHRERDREGVYTRRGNHDYLPRLDTKSIRHREGDKERRDAAWENGGGGGTTSRGPSTRDRRSRSKEREKERERSGDKSVKEPRSSKAALKIPVVADLGKVKIEKEKKRDRSPMDSYRGNGKRPKDGPSDDPKAVEKLAALPENKLLESDFPTKVGHIKDKKPNRHESEERSLSSSDLKNKGHTSILVDEMENEVFVEMFVESCDQDTRSWLASKQNAIFLREDYGITLLRKETSSTDLTKMEQPEALHLKLSGQISENCDISEAKYFVARAANVIKEIARRGVFLKSLWYPGPVQPYSSDAPPVHMVVRKLKGDDGKNLDRIQDATGIMVGIILDADNKKAGSNSKTSVVGIRLRSSRKKGLTEATKKCRDLLQEVAASFAKEMDIIAKEKENAANDGKVRPLYVSQLPEYASARMLRAIFENVLREKLKKETEHPPGFEQSTDMVSDVKYASEDGCAFVEFASDDLLEGALQLYAADKDVFCGLKVELPTPAAMRIYEQLLGESESAETKLLKAKIVKDVQAQISDSEDYMLDDQTRPRKAVKPLFLTELIRAATSDSVKRLFEEIIATHINPSLDGKSVLAVRHIPTRGCMFVDLATPELVEFMLELHTRKPDVFGHMKMELGRSHAAHDGVDRKRSFSNLDRSRSERNLSPRPKRRATDNEEDLEDGFGRRSAKQRSDPEKTVYADHLPENSSDMVIRKIFRTVLLEHMTAQQRAALGEEVVTEVRHVRMKYCAFVVFVSEELARLALELYSRDEEIFDHMRLKPHFNSRLEDIYKEDGHENNKDDDTPIIFEHGGKSELDFQDSSRAAAVAGGAGAGAGGGRGSGSSSRGFKEVDRRRSVYVDRIPDKYPETAIKEVLDKFLRRKGRGSPSYVVSHVSFFRDKYDPSKLCAFVEVKNEDAVQDLLDCYADDEGAFDGMRIRPAVKYN